MDPINNTIDILTFLVALVAATGNQLRWWQVDTEIIVMIFGGIKGFHKFYGQFYPGNNEGGGKTSDYFVFISKSLLLKTI